MRERSLGTRKPVEGGIALLGIYRDRDNGFLRQIGENTERDHGTKINLVQPIWSCPVNGQSYPAPTDGSRPSLRVEERTTWTSRFSSVGPPSYPPSSWIDLFVLSIEAKICCLSGLNLKSTYMKEEWFGWCIAVRRIRSGGRLPTFF